MIKFFQIKQPLALRPGMLATCFCCIAFLMACGGSGEPQSSAMNSSENTAVTPDSTPSGSSKPEGDAGASVTLASQLDAKKDQFLAKAPQSKIEAYDRGIDDIRQNGLLEQALNVGDEAPDFALQNATGNTIQLSEMLKSGPVILTWYRGGWCPYCNITLHYLQEFLPRFREAGAQLVALTPELPDKSLSTKEKHALEFEVLTDLNQAVAREYGIVFKLIDEVAGLYKQSFDLAEYNGSDNNELPLAATYIVGTDGKIQYAFLDADYRNRAEPADILAALKQ